MRVLVIVLLVLGGGAASKKLLEAVNVFVWNASSENFLTRKNVPIWYMPECKSKIETERIRVGVHRMLPYASLGEGDQIGGFLGDLWEIMHHSLGFNYTARAIDYDDGLAEIENDEVDVFLTAAVYKEGLDVHYPQPYFLNWYHLYTKCPQGKPSSMSYLTVFCPKLWFATVYNFLAMGSILWLMCECLKKVRLQSRTVSPPSCFLATISGFLGQCYEVPVSAHSARLLLFTSALVGYIIYVAINATLVARLAVLDVEWPFKDIEEIAAKKTHHLCVRNNSFVYNNFTDPDQNLLPKWQGIVNGPRCLDIGNKNNIVKVICDDDVVVLESVVMMAAVLRKELPCCVSHLPTRYFKSGNYFVMSNSFQGKFVINRELTALRSSGVLEILLNKWVRVFKETKTALSYQATLDHVSGLLITYAILIGTSLIVLGLEILCRRWGARSRGVGGEGWRREVYVGR
ncbi:uncharacterized protein LOC132702344 [Cylas formicarius]|uniref:uncharacterized protein LOC132702344 n=1 Tax=Cylas formicarius TaxID=197179 RepID=UPI0029583C50|nr:uncharacterized protein LOC132702344 [Cylas formicarius]